MDPKPNLFPIGFVQGAWNSNGGMKSVVWGSVKYKNTRTGQKPNLFLLGFVQGAWNCDGGMESVVWENMNDLL